MRTTLDLPEDLVREAMRAARVKTKTKAITIALEELIQRSRLAELKKYRGKVDLDIDLNELRDRNAHPG